MGRGSYVGAALSILIALAYTTATAERRGDASEAVDRTSLVSVIYFKHPNYYT